MCTHFSKQHTHQQQKHKADVLPASSCTQQIVCLQVSQARALLEVQKREG